MRYSTVPGRIRCAAASVVRDACALLLLCAAIILTGCGVPCGSQSPEAGISSSAPGYTTYFEPVADSRLGESAVRFFSTDSSFRGSAGYSFWMFGTGSASFREPGGFLYRASVDRVSGNPAAGFGIIFAVQDNGMSFYVLLIDAEGNWELGQVTDRRFTALGEGWAPAGGALKTGYNQVNEIGVLVNGSTGSVEITPLLNGNWMVPVRDEDSTVYTGGAFGFIVTTSPSEPAPTSPVDVRFAPLLPASLGLEGDE